MSFFHKVLISWVILLFFIIHCRQFIRTLNLSIQFNCAVIFQPFKFSHMRPYLRYYLLLPLHLLKEYQADFWNFHSPRTYDNKKMRWLVLLISKMRHLCQFHYSQYQISESIAVLKPASSPSSYMYSSGGISPVTATLIVLYAGLLAADLL